MLKKFLLFIFPFILFAKTYPIVEPDPIEEITKIAKEKEKKLEKYIKETAEKVWKYEALYLPPAPKNATRYIDPTYCLERDIKIPITDRNNHIKGWKVLYPKGYCFNPLDYISVAPPPMVIFNACRNAELKYVQNIVYPKYPEAIYIVSGCTLKEVNDIAKHSFLKNLHWFFLNKRLKDRLKLRYTVSIVSIFNRTIKVEEIKVSPQKTNID